MGSMTGTMSGIHSFAAGAMAASTVAAALCFGMVLQQKRDGYTDTPVLPGQKWKVHDTERPYPREVIPALKAGAPPSDAIILFNGKDLTQWIQNDPGDDMSKAKPAKWKLIDSCIEVVPGSGSLYSKDKFGDIQMHIEWQQDAKVTGSGQNRGNSGIYLMGMFELQVLDSYKANTYADGQAGAMYGQWSPMVNPMRKPGEWQTYDIVFETPKFQDGKLVSPAYVTLLFNGVVVHHRQKYYGPSAHRSIQDYFPMSAEGRISLQDHGPKEKLRFRNIWVRKLTGYDQP
jgi:hypothetical protein